MSTTRSRSHLLLTAGAGLALALMTGCSVPAPEPTAAPTSTPDDGVISFRDLLGLVTAEDWLPSIEYDGSEAIKPASEYHESVFLDWATVAGSPESCFGAYALQRLVGVAEDGARADDYIMFVGVWEEDGADTLPIGDVFVHARTFDDEETAAGFLGELEAAAATCPTGYAFGGVDRSGYYSTGMTVSEFPGLPETVASRVLDETTAPDQSRQTQRTVLLQHDNLVIALEIQITPEASFTAADVDPLILTIADRVIAL